MQVPTDKSSVIRFGVFEVDLQQAELRKGGVKVEKIVEAIVKRWHGEILSRCGRAEARPVEVRG